MHASLSPRVLIGKSNGDYFIETVTSSHRSACARALSNASEREISTGLTGAVDVVKSLVYSVNSDGTSLGRLCPPTAGGGCNRYIFWINPYSCHESRLAYYTYNECSSAPIPGQQSIDLAWCPRALRR